MARNCFVFYSISINIMVRPISLQMPPVFH
nr:MAG TPA: hypothetical protein [Caudoviricetes sp.]